MTVTSVRINKDLEEPLAELAKKHERSKNYIINQSVKEFIARERQADYRWQETLEALDSIEQGKAVDGAKVSAWIESWGTEGELLPPKS